MEIHKAMSELVKMTDADAHREVTKEAELSMMPGVKMYLKIPCKGKEDPCVIWVSTLNSSTL